VGPPMCVGNLADKLSDPCVRVLHTNACLIPVLVLYGTVLAYYSPGSRLVFSFLFIARGRSPVMGRVGARGWICPGRCGSLKFCELLR